MPFFYCQGGWEGQYSNLGGTRYTRCLHIPRHGPELCKIHDSYEILGGSLSYEILGGSLCGGDCFGWPFLAAWEAWRFLAGCSAVLVCNSELVWLFHHKSPADSNFWNFP